MSSRTASGFRGRPDHGPFPTYGVGSGEGNSRFQCGLFMTPQSPLPPQHNGKKEARYAADTFDGKSDLSKLRRRMATATVLAAMVLVVVDAAITNIALPTIAESLHVTPGMSVGAITAYQCALLMALFPSAALGESIGYRKVFSGGIALFTLASVLCALSPSLNWLLAARFIQGIGGAGIMALGVAILRSVVLPQQLGAAIGWNALAVALSSAVGPVIGATVLSFTTWPWLFAVNLPLGVLVLLSARSLPNGVGTARRLDLLSVFLNAGGFASLVIGAELLPTRPAMALLVFAAAALQLVALIFREIPKKAPLIPLDLLRTRPFLISVVASVFCFAGQTASMVALPFYLQHELGRDMLKVGLYMTPWPLSVAVAAAFAGRVADHISTARLCAIGGMCLASGLGAAACWPLQGNPAPLVPLTMLCGVGFGIFNVANNRSMFSSAPVERSGSAGGMQGTARLSGQLAGAVTMALLFSVISADAAPRIGLGIGSVLAAVAALVSTLRVTPMGSR